MFDAAQAAWIVAHAALNLIYLMQILAILT